MNHIFWSFTLSASVSVVGRGKLSNVQYIPLTRHDAARRLRGRPHRRPLRGRLRQISLDIKVQCSIIHILVVQEVLTHLP